MVNFFYEDNLIQKDKEWRRKERLRQVREQERMISRKQTERYNQKKEEMIADAAYKFAVEWKIEHDDLLKRLTERYEMNLASLGCAHDSASHFIDNEYITANDQVFFLIMIILQSYVWQEQKKRSKQRSKSAYKSEILKSKREKERIENVKKNRYATNSFYGKIQREKAHDKAEEEKEAIKLYNSMSTNQSPNTSDSFERIEDRVILDSSDMLMGFTHHHYPIELTRENNINNQRNAYQNAVEAKRIFEERMKYKQLEDARNYQLMLERGNKAEKVIREKKESEIVLNGLNSLFRDDMIQRTQRPVSLQREEIIRKTSVRRSEKEKQINLQNEFEKLFN